MAFNMINLAAIHRDNIILEPFEHILVDFIDADYVRDTYAEYEESSVVLTQFNEFNNQSPHPLQKLLEQHRGEIIKRVNDLWDLDIVTVSMSTSMFDKTSKLDAHNDYYPDDGWLSIPARGIIYLNDEKVFGTNIHQSERGLGVEIGGMPGQLLLFKVSENSWHSAGVNCCSNFRIAVNLLLKREGSIQTPVNTSNIKTDSEYNS
jgi:hypothetical protein